MLECGSKICNCFLDVRKASQTVWIDGLLFELCTELGITGGGGGGGGGVAMKDFYTDELCSLANCPDYLISHMILVREELSHPL